jgi:hypothetical protein
MIQVAKEQGVPALQESTFRKVRDSIYLPNLAFLLSAMDRHELTTLFWSDVEAVAARFNVGIEEQYELCLRDLIEDDIGRIPEVY